MPGERRRRLHEPPRQLSLPHHAQVVVGHGIPERDEESLHRLLQQPRDRGECNADNGDAQEPDNREGRDDELLGARIARGHQGHNTAEDSGQHEKVTQHTAHIRQDAGVRGPGR